MVLGVLVALARRPGAATVSSRGFLPRSALALLVPVPLTTILVRPLLTPCCTALLTPCCTALLAPCRAALLALAGAIVLLTWGLSPRAHRSLTTIVPGTLPLGVAGLLSILGSGIGTLPGRLLVPCIVARPTPTTPTALGPLIAPDAWHRVPDLLRQAAVVASIPSLLLALLGRSAAPSLLPGRILLSLPLLPLPLPASILLGASLFLPAAPWLVSLLLVAGRRSLLALSLVLVATLAAAAGGLAALVVAVSTIVSLSLPLWRYAAPALLGPLASVGLLVAVARPVVARLAAGTGSAVR